MEGEDLLGLGENFDFAEFADVLDDPDNMSEKDPNEKPEDPSSLQRQHQVRQPRLPHLPHSHPHTVRLQEALGAQGVRGLQVLLFKDSNLLVDLHRLDPHLLLIQDLDQRTNLSYWKIFLSKKNVNNNNKTLHCNNLVNQDNSLDNQDNQDNCLDNQDNCLDNLDNCLDNLDKLVDILSRVHPNRYNKVSNNNKCPLAVKFSSLQLCNSNLVNLSSLHRLVVPWDSPYPASLCQDSLCRASPCRANLCQDSLCRANLCQDSLCRANPCRDNLCRDNLCQDSPCQDSLCQDSPCQDSLCPLVQSCIRLGSKYLNNYNNQDKHLQEHFLSMVSVQC